MKENKQKFGLWVHPSTLEKVDNAYKLAECRSRSEYIEKAILHYTGYLMAQNSQDYLSDNLLSTFQGKLDGFEDRIASLIFKYAVELSMLMHVAAANFNVNEDTISRLRGKCVTDVKKSRGSISFDEIVRYQKGKK